MFAPRFDPAAFTNDIADVVNENLDNEEGVRTKKRKFSDASSASEDESEGEKPLSSSSEQELDSEEEDSEDSEKESGEEIEEEKEDGEEIVGQSEQEENQLVEEESEDKMDIDELPGEETKPIENDPEYVSKHHSIFSKFKTSVPHDKVIQQEEDQEETSDEIEQQDLAPLPQPELPRDKKLVATSAHLKNLDWLTTPVYASPDNTKPFVEFPLSPFMMKNLKNSGFENAFSVQISVLNLLLRDIEKNQLQPDIRGDLLVNASTGSGKTLAYSIPIIESLYKRIVPRVRAVILVPTKPLINQVKATLLQLSKGTNLSIVNLKGGISIKEEASRLVKNEPDIIISTPGRLVEHLTNESINLKNLQYLIIDEADRLLNQSFQNWCQILVSKIEQAASVSNKWKLSVKKLIFSATLTTDSGKLSLLKFCKPRLIIVNDREQLVNEMFSVPSTLSEFKLQFGSAKLSLKPLILSKFLIHQKKLSNVLIFTKSNESSLRLARLLSLIFNKLLPGQSLEVSYINSTNNTSSTRKKILKDFSKQSIHILVATDLISRGIDILSVSDVINYDLPNSSREYVHRVGRTARANQQGFAYSLCFGKGENKWFNKLKNDVARREKQIEDLEIDIKDLITASDESIYKLCLEELQKQVFNRN